MLSKHAVPSNELTLASLTEEALVSIACYLPSVDIRALSSTSVRSQAALMQSQGARDESLWMEILQGKFPQVFAVSVSVQIPHLAYSILPLMHDTHRPPQPPLCFIHIHRSQQLLTLHSFGSYQAYPYPITHHSDTSMYESQCSNV